MWSGEDASLPGLLRLGMAGDLLASFDFGGRTGQHSHPSIAFTQQARFQQDFKQQLEKIQVELARYKDRNGIAWLPLDAALPPRTTSGPYQPRSDLHVFVSEAYPRSRALVPAWLGQRGWMEFPAHRVVAGEAGIAHELVHVLFPNGNRMLAEGLAIYLQDKLFPNDPVYPGFGDRLEALIGDFLRARYKDGAHLALWSIDLDGLEQISTPDKFRLRIGRDGLIGARPGIPDPPADEVKPIYAIAGSLVELLLDNLIGDDLFTEENFGTLYKSTPLRPLERDPGAPERWRTAYQAEGRCYSFSEIGLLWKTYMHFILFGRGPRGEVPIPAKFAKMALVAELHEKLNMLTGARPAPSAGPAKTKKALSVARPDGRLVRRATISRKQPNRIAPANPSHAAQALSNAARSRPNR